MPHTTKHVKAWSKLTSNVTHIYQLHKTTTITLRKQYTALLSHSPKPIHSRHTTSHSLGEPRKFNLHLSHRTPYDFLSLPFHRPPTHPLGRGPQTARSQKQYYSDTKTQGKESYTMATTPAPSDPNPSDPKVASSALDFLLIELVPLAQRMATELHARDTALLSASLDRTLALNDSTSTTTAATGPDKRSSVRSTAVTGTGKDGEDEEEDEERRGEDVLFRLDALGYRVGQGLVERYISPPSPSHIYPPFATMTDVPSFSLNTPRPQTPLDMIKFICKDLWTLLFRKQIDNLKTNHRGTFVLTDTRFNPLSRMSVDTRRGPKGVEEALRSAQPVCFTQWGGRGSGCECVLMWGIVFVFSLWCC